MYREWFSLIAGCAVAAAPLAAQAAPQVDVNVQIGNVAAPAVAVSHVYRGSTIVGMPVKNAEKKDLGKIQELVIDTSNGQVRYAALSFGGVLGIGDKLFAVPMSSLMLKVDENDKYFVLNATPEQLKAAPGFDQKNWPDTANPAWSAEIDKHFGVRRPSTVVNGTIQPSSSAAPQIENYAPVYRMSHLVGMQVKTPQQQDLGKIHELVIDLGTGKVRYAAMSFGGFLGLGTKLFAIPWNALALRHTDDQTYFVLNVSVERLKEAPGFDSNNWPDTADPEFSRRIDDFYRQDAPQSQVK